MRVKFLLYNHWLKKIAWRLLHSPWFNRNTVYRRLLGRRVELISALHRKAPACVRVENTNHCNAHCSMCPHDEMTRSKGTMGQEMFAEIVSQCVAGGVTSINLHNFGEPLLDKHFAAKVRHAKESGIARVSTNSNGALLTETRSRELLEAGLDELYVSIDAASAATYEKVRHGLSYEKLRANLEAFVRIKRETGATTRLVVNFVQTQDNIHEVQDFIDLWKGEADEACISFPHDWVGAGKDDLGMRSLPQPCKLLFTDLTISWNGDILLCCADYDGRSVLGNIAQDRLIDFWQNNAEMNRFRAAHLADNGARIKPCDTCTLNTIWWL